MAIQVLRRLPEPRPPRLIEGVWAGLDLGCWPRRRPERLPAVASPAEFRDLRMPRCPGTPWLWLDDGPASTSKLDGEWFGGHLAQDLLLGGPSPCWDLDRLLRVELCVPQPLDERVSLGTGELARSLTLRESHRAARVSKVTMTGLLEQGQQFLHLPRRRRRS